MYGSGSSQWISSKPRIPPLTVCFCENLFSQWLQTWGSYKVARFPSWKIKNNEMYRTTERMFFYPVFSGVWAK